MKITLATILFGIAVCVLSAAMKQMERRQREEAQIEVELNKLYRNK